MYQAPNMNLWKGRKNPGAVMFHEAIQPLDLTNDLWSPDTPCNIAFLGYACDEGVRRNMGRVGAQQAPDEIRKIISLMAVHHDTNHLSLLDAGNVICASQNLEGTNELLAQKIKSLLNHGIFPIVLGGGHETAYPHFKAIKSALNTSESIGIINFDAHFDMRTYENGAHSGSPFRQLLNESIKAGESFHYYPVGIRAESNTTTLFEVMNKYQQPYLLLEDVQASFVNALEELLKFSDKMSHLYITIDMDCFSAAYAPGVSAAAPDGLLPGQVRAFLYQLINTKKVRSIDIVETNPTYDDGRTLKLVSHLIFHIISGLSKI